MFSDRFTWQVTGCVIIVAVVLDEGRWGRNVARLHRGHAGSSGNRRGLAVEVLHPEETQRQI